MADPTDAEIERLRHKAVSELGLLDDAADETFDRIVRLARTVLGASAAAFGIIDETRLYLKSRDGIDVRELPHRGALCNPTAGGDTTLQITDTLADPGLRAGPLVTGPMQIRSCISVPVRVPGAVTVGALCVFDREVRRFEVQQSAVLEDLRTLLEESLRLRSQSLLDPLTGIYNRRHLKKSLSQEWQRAIRQQSPLAVLMIDIDHFKAYNDSYGHFAGDKCLQTVCELMHDQIQRPADVLSRFGGEEFLMLLPETDFAGMELIANRTLQAVRSARIPHQKSPNRYLSISIGGAAIEPEALQRITPEDLLKAADRCLYGAKTTGRNNAYFTRVSEPLGTTE